MDALATVKSEKTPRPQRQRAQKRAPRLKAAADELLTVCIDQDPVLLAESYRLRYHAYCVGREFLPASDYPSGLETDEFDRFARHFAALDADGHMVGTVRVVLPSVVGFPLFRHCTVFPTERALYDTRHRVAEISRLVVCSGEPRSQKATACKQPFRANGFLRRDAAVFSLYRAVYHDARRMGLTHWAIAVEGSLWRSLASYGFVFRQIGPEVDYFGPVAPYLMDIGTLDRLLIEGTQKKLDGFLDGLEERFRPRAPKTSRVVRSR